MQSFKAWREAEGLTLVEVAKRVAVSDASISRIENGTQCASRKLAVRLEELTKIPAAEFVMGRVA